MGETGVGEAGPGGTGPGLIGPGGTGPGLIGPAGPGGTAPGDAPPQEALRGNAPSGQALGADARHEDARHEDARRGDARRGDAPPGRAPRADRAPWLIAAVVFAAYTVISVSRLVRLDPGSWDLGIFTEEVKRYASLQMPVADIRAPGFNLLGDHFSPIVALAAPFFRVFPSPATLLVIQALLTAVSVVPVCAAARELLGRGPSRLIGIAYGFSWGLQQMINFDFHEVAFAVPLLAFCLSALVRGRPRAALWWGLPLVFVKEDEGLRLAVIGAVMLVAAGWAAAGRGRWPSGPGTQWLARGREGPRVWAWTGAVLVAWGLAWSALAILVIIPHFNPAHHYPYWKNGGVIHPGGAVSLSALVHQLAAGGGVKLRTTLFVALPVVFLGLGSPLAAAAAVGLVLRFVSTNPYFWGTGYHYNATVMPVMFLAAIDTLGWMSARAAARRARASPRRARRARPAWRPGAASAWSGAAAMLVVAGFLAVRFPLASLWNSQTYTVSAHVHAEDAAMARVPDGVTVEATLSMLAPLAARDTTYWIGLSGNPPPRYIVFDESNSGWNPPPTNVLAFVEQRHPGATYRRIFLSSDVYVFVRTGAIRRSG